MQKELHHYHIVSVVSQRTHVLCINRSQAIVMLKTGSQFSERVMHYNIFVRIFVYNYYTLLSRDTYTTRHRSQEIMIPFKNRADLHRQMKASDNYLMIDF